MAGLHVRTLELRDANRKRRPERDRERERRPRRPMQGQAEDERLGEKWMPAGQPRVVHLGDQPRRARWREPIEVEE